MAGSSIHHRLLFKNSPLGMVLRFNNSHAYFSAIKIFEVDMLLYFLNKNAYSRSSSVLRRRCLSALCCVVPSSEYDFIYRYVLQKNVAVHL